MLASVDAKLCWYLLPVVLVVCYVMLLVGGVARCVVGNAASNVGLSVGSGFGLGFVAHV